MEPTILRSLARSRNLSRRLPALWIMLAVFNLQAFTYTDFNSTNGLSLVGASAVVGGALRLTPAVEGVVGTAWAIAKQSCSGGFDTQFQFRISNSGSRPGTPPGADGVLFTIQKNGPTDPICHGLLSPADGSVSVFFNTFWNWPDSTDFTKWDVSGNSVGVLSNALYLGQTDLTSRGINLEDGAVHNARIAFDGMGLTVWLDSVMLLTNIPVPGMASAVDADGKAWVGFGAGTGWAWENHDILSWSYSSAASPACVSPPSGLVGWWRGEGDVLDQVGGNNGSLHNGVGYTSGEVGQAFRFNGTNSYVEVPDSPALRLPNQLTIEFWVKRQQGDWPAEYLLNKGGDWTRGGLNYGAGIDHPGLNNRLSFFFAGGTRGAGSITDLSWHHCAIVARQGDVDPTFYLDGVVQPVMHREGASTINLYPSTEPLYIGAQVDPISGWYYYSKAIVDELSIYNRALAAAEIQAIYNAGSSGKCVVNTPPTITSQPANQTVIAGDNAAFGVLATGTQPLSYQWNLNGSSLLGATNSSLALTNVQLSQAGSYTVLVTNLAGSVLSSNAVLTVNLPPPCAPPPAGLVGWWRGEGNAFDQLGTNNGTPAGNTTYGVGRVGRAFVLGGANGDGVTLGNPSGLQLQDLTIEAWIRRASASQVTRGYYDGGDFLAYGSGGYGFAMYANGSLTFGKSYVSEVRSIPGLVADTNWHHVAVSKSGSTVVYYVDGVAYPVAAYTATFTFTTTAAIGMLGNSLYGFWGSIDELAVYNRALTAAEVQAIYNADGTGKCPLNRIPVAVCANAVVSAGTNCQADASVNNGSFDPDGDPITISQVPPGPYPLGTNLVTLTVTDNQGASNSCSALVIVLNNLPPLTYTNFNSTNGLSLVGASAVVGGALRLTPATESVTGTGVGDRQTSRARPALIPNSSSGLVIRVPGPALLPVPTASCSHSRTLDRRTQTCILTPRPRTAA